MNRIFKKLDLRLATLGLGILALSACATPVSSGPDPAVRPCPCCAGMTMSGHCLGCHGYCPMMHGSGSCTPGCCASMAGKPSMCMACRVTH